MEERLHKMVDGEKIYLTSEEEAAVRAEWAANDAEAANTAWLNNRLREYPSIPAQLEMMYSDKINGTNEWADCITAIKNKYPKPPQ